MNRYNKTIISPHFLVDNKYMAQNNTKKRNTGLAVAICLLLALVLVILFLVKKDQMVTNLKETNFFERVIGKTPDFVENHVSQTKNDDEQLPLPEEVPLTINLNPEVAPVKKVDDEETVSQVIRTEEKEAEQKKIEEQKATKVEEKKTEKPVEQKPKTDLVLCFVTVDSEGSISRKMVKRSVEKNNSPLTTSINLLMKGPDKSLASEKDCISLIPGGSKLISASVKDGVAYLNFSDSFEFNPDGDGYLATQLMQVVYTATTFSTVNSVQFLIEGEKREYLGSEGQWIGTPLSRNSFN